MSKTTYDRVEEVLEATNPATALAHIACQLAARNTADDIVISMAIRVLLFNTGYEVTLSRIEKDYK